MNPSTLPLMVRIATITGMHRRPESGLKVRGLQMRTGAMANFGCP